MMNDTIKSSLRGTKQSLCRPYLRLTIVCRFCIVMLFSCTFSINHANAVKPPVTPKVFEIIAPVDQPFSSHALTDFCKKGHIPLSQIYQWNNHLVIYGFLDKPWEIKKQLAIKYPGCEIKVYDHPFYNFTRAQRCGTGKLAKQWDNIILTANMVEDVKMQKEYLSYHATQFQKWPEVSQGFCNAGFQQLLVFKNGRQLMLIISIPKGESLDKLNPLTSKNNPRVDQWNALMKKYQEGIPGTKKGETWVFLKPITN